MTLQQLRKNYDAATEELEKSNKVLANNQQVMKYLNHQLDQEKTKGALRGAGDPLSRHQPFGANIGGGGHSGFRPRTMLPASAMYGTYNRFRTNNTGADKFTNLSKPVIGTK